MTQHRVVLRRRRPWLGVVALSLFAALLAVAGYLAYAYLRDPDRVGFSAGASEVDQMRAERRRLTRELRAAREEIEELRGRSTFEARSCEIDAQACEAVKKSVTGLESEVADLREQLTFYRNIVAPEQNRAGIRVLRAALRPGATSETWRYELVLVQPVRRDRKVTGHFDLNVEGMLDKQLKTLAVADMQVADPGSRVFGFRSFQEFSGELRLPAGFLPSRLSVTLSVDEGLSTPTQATESFDWSRLVESGKE